MITIGKIAALFLYVNKTPCKMIFFLSLLNWSHHKAYEIICQSFIAITCWRHGMETLSALLALSEGNPPAVAGGLP